MPDNYPLLEILGGFSLIMIGIQFSGTSLQKLLGSRLEKLLEKAKGRPLRGLAVGTLATALIHSSGTTAVMLISLISGSIMSFADTVPVMLGANIGSTVSTQLVSFDIGGYVFLLLTLGVLIYMNAEKKADKQLGEAVVGFGLLLLGAQFLFSGVAAVAGDASLSGTLRVLNASPAAAILVGALFTALLRSAGFMSILTVAAGAAGAIGLTTAVHIILGINLGSSFKFIQLAVSGKNFSGRLAFVHLLANLLGVCLVLTDLDFFAEAVRATSATSARQLANAYTLYCLLTAIIFVPLVPLALKLSERIAPSSGQLKQKELANLDRKLIYTPSISLSEIDRGAVVMARLAAEMLDKSRDIFFAGQTTLLSAVQERESRIDAMTNKITEFTIQVSQQNLSHDDEMRLYSLMHIIAEIEHLCDRIVAVSRLYVTIRIEGSAEFTLKAQEELTAVYGKLSIMQNLTVKALAENNTRLASEISEHENKVDEIIKKIVTNNCRRAEQGQCTPDTSRYFSEILYHLERIGDHYDNIAFAVMDRVGSDKRK